MMHHTRFDLLDHLHTIDADTRWITRDDLATTLNVGTEAVHKRMRGLEADGLAEIQRYERSDRRDNRQPPPRYRVTGHGTALYRMELARMCGEVVVPVIHPDLVRAYSVTVLTHALGMEAAA